MIKAARFSAGAAILGTVPFSSVVAAGPSKEKFLAYVGTYTGPKSKGIYCYRFDSATGKMESLGLAAEAVSPAFLAVHPTKPLVYAVNEIDRFEGKPVGGVSAFEADLSSGRLTLINKVSSGGTGPCHLTVDRKGRCVLVANYGGGSVSSLRILPNGGLEGPIAFIQHKGSSVNPARQKEPHAHSVNVSPDNRFAFVADLGLDKILIYELNSRDATLKPAPQPHVAVAPGAGPRHFAFHPSGRHAYVINEMHCTITAFTYKQRTGELNVIQTISTLPTGQDLKPEYSTAEIVVHPSGRFLYGSNRGHDTIAGFTIARDGTLSQNGHTPTQGRTPRNFAIDPTGSCLIAENQSSDSFVPFAIDQKSGALTPTGERFEVGSPVCIRFLPIR